VRALLEDVAARWPVLLVLDDVHPIDDLTTLVTRLRDGQGYDGQTPRPAV